MKRGQTLQSIAFAFSCPERLIVKANDLQGEVNEGEILWIPSVEGNLYTVRGGESKSQLCGSRERFFEKNGTHCLYPTQKVIL